MVALWVIETVYYNMSFCPACWSINMAVFLSTKKATVIDDIKTENHLGQNLFSSQSSQGDDDGGLGCTWL
eukprot:5124991-Ditylum_brightwellii.AAC.1